MHITAALPSCPGLCITQHVAVESQFGCVVSTIWANIDARLIQYAASSNERSSSPGSTGHRPAHFSIGVNVRAPFSWGLRDDVD